jgi:hypothetical protein
MVRKGLSTLLLAVMQQLAQQGQKQGVSSRQLCQMCWYLAPSKALTSREMAHSPALLGKGTTSAAGLQVLGHIYR